MPGKGKKVQSKPITAYVNSDGECNLSSSGSSRLCQLELQTESHIGPPVTLNAIAQIVVQEIGKIKSGVKQFKDEICKAFDSLKHWVDSRLLDITQKIQMLEEGQKESVQQVNIIKNQIGQLDNKIVKLDTAFRMVEDDFKLIETGSDRLHWVVEDLDNNL